MERGTLPSASPSDPRLFSSMEPSLNRKHTAEIAALSKAEAGTRPSSFSRYSWSPSVWDRKANASTGLSSQARLQVMPLTKWEDALAYMASGWDESLTGQLRETLKTPWVSGAPIVAVQRVGSMGTSADS